MNRTAGLTSAEYSIHALPWRDYYIMNAYHGHMSNPLRRAFFDRTNVNTEIQKQVPLRRKLDEDPLGSNKRLKHADSAVVPLLPKQRFRDITNVTNFRRLKLNKKQGYHSNLASSPLSSRSILSSLVSSQKSDRYCLHLRDDNIAPAIPFSCAFSKGAKHGKSSLLSIGTQDGTVEILDVKPRLDWEGEPQRSVLQIHDSAIFALQYRYDDEYIATASHDSTCRITSLSTQQCTAVLAGHIGPVKTIDWVSNHNSLLCTGGRDGSVLVWDIRCASGGSDTISPACKIHDAHAENTSTGKRKKTASLRSITSVVSVPGTSQVISSSSFDAKLHHWDCRFINDSFSVKDFGGSLDDPTLATSSRSRGISGLALGSNLTAGYLWSIAADSRYTIPLSAPSLYQPKALSHPNLKVRSFHVKLAVSPCGRWLASGSSNGGTYVWDVNDPLSSTAVELVSSTKEVGPLDWGSDMLATCCDDGIVRVWRPNLEAASQCKANPEEESWNWFWSKDL